MAASAVDGDLHRCLIDPKNYSDDLYKRALAPLVRLHSADPDIFYLYTMVDRERRDAARRRFLHRRLGSWSPTARRQTLPRWTGMPTLPCIRREPKAGIASACSSRQAKRSVSRPRLRKRRHRRLKPYLIPLASAAVSFATSAAANASRATAQRQWRRA